MVGEMEAVSTINGDRDGGYRASRLVSSAKGSRLAAFSCAALLACCVRLLPPPCAFSPLFSAAPEETR
jgi:hypothetical protein